MPPPMPYWPEDTDPDPEMSRHDPWPVDTNPSHPIPRPPLTLVSAEGRFPHRGGSFRLADLHVQVESGWEPGVVLVRLDLEGERSDFWAQLGFCLTPASDDPTALARLADDGNPHGGD